MSVRCRRWKDPKTGKSKESWQIDILHVEPNGDRVRVKKKARIQTRRAAEQEEREIRLALAAGTYGKAAVNPKIAPTLEEFVPRFLTFSENNNKHSTVVGKRHALDVHLLPFFGKMPLDQIGPAQLEEFKAAMRKTVTRSRGRKVNPTKWAIKKRKNVAPRFLSPKSINNLLAVLRKLLAVAQEQGVLEHVPRVRFFRAERPQFDFLSFDEAERLAAAAEAEWRPLLLVALKAGLRLGEILGLQWADLDLVAGRLVVRRNIWRGVTNTPKGGRTREIPLSDALLTSLKTHRHLKGPYVFCDETGKPLTEGDMKRPLVRALLRAGIARESGRIGWHDLRHTFASHLAMKGVPLKVIQELLGHASIEMTMRYAHLSPDVKKDAVKVLDEPRSSSEKRTDSESFLLTTT